MLSEIIAVAKECGLIIHTSVAKDIQIKNHNRKDLVTNYDKQIQNILRDKLLKILPDASFLGEEGHSEYKKEGWCFVCDPIDGTTNFIKNYQCSAVSIGLLKDGKPFLGVIYNPFLDELFYAEKSKGAFCNNKQIHTSKENLSNSLAAFGTGSFDLDKTWDLVKKYYDASLDVRRSGSAAVDLCNLACGRTGIFWELKLQPWDFAAGVLIVSEAGGAIKINKDHNLEDYFSPSSIFALANENIEVFPF